MSPLPSVYLPPMAGVTDLAFRRVVREVLGDLQDQVLLSTEMISSRGILHQNNPARMKLHPDEIGRVVIQLFGHEPAVLAESARIAESAGCARIDLNMGCPVPKIVKGKDGAALMKEPHLAKEIARQVVQAVKIPVSVKTRLGWDEQHKNGLELAQRLQDQGISFITIHGRTRAQGYSGQADWAAIAEIAEALKIPVLGNGDINSPAKAQQALQTMHTHGIAVARAAIGNPWLLRDIVRHLLGKSSLPPPTLSEKLAVIRKHLQWAHEDKGLPGVQAAKKHLGKYISDFSGAAHWRNQLATANSYPEMLDRLTQLEGAIHE